MAKYNNTAPLWIGAITAGGFWIGVILFSAWTEIQHHRHLPVPQALTAPLLDTAERHFPCTVVDTLTMPEGSTLYLTECGVPFTSESPLHIGDTLHHFKSPKHQ